MKRYPEKDNTKEGVQEKWKFKATERESERQPCKSQLLETQADSQFFHLLLNVSCGEMRAVGLECSSDRDKITMRVHTEAK